jgi:hypothetical protein
VPVNMTFHMKGWIAWEHHSPEKEKFLSSSVSFVIYFRIGWGAEREFCELVNTYSRAHRYVSHLIKRQEARPFIDEDPLFRSQTQVIRGFETSWESCCHFYCDGINAVCLTFRRHKSFI